MSDKFLYILLFTLAAIIGCHNPVDTQTKKDSQKHNTETVSLIPVNYDFDNLDIHLNANINDPNSKIEWRWDYMSSNNGVPDTVGMDYYMNISQPVFEFNGETTLPALSVKTNGNKIMEFSATTIFSLPDQNSENITLVLESLKRIDLLKDESIRRKILETGKYKTSTEHAVEKISLELSEEAYGYNRIMYSIKTIL